MRVLHRMFSSLRPSSHDDSGKPFGIQVGGLPLRAAGLYYLVGLFEEIMDSIKEFNYALEIFQILF